MLKEAAQSSHHINGAGAYYYYYYYYYYYLLLAQVTYNQVQPLRINYLASSHRGIIALIVSSKIV